MKKSEKLKFEEIKLGTKSLAKLSLIVIAISMLGFMVFHIARIGISTDVAGPKIYAHEPVIIGNSWSKRVDVYHNEPTHYYNVSVSTSISESLADVELYRYVTDTTMKKITDNIVYNFQLKDVDSNGKYDTASWIVPELSEVSFSVEGIIIEQEMPETATTMPETTTPEIKTQTETEEVKVQAPAKQGVSTQEPQETVTYTPSTETHCSNGKCWTALYSGTVFTKEPDGNWYRFPEASNVTWINSENVFNFSYRKYWVTIEPFVIYNGNFRTIQWIKDNTDVNIKDYIQVSKFNHKFAINYSNVPQNLVDNTDYLGFMLKDSHGLTWDDVNKTSNRSIVIKNKVEINYYDLIESGFTLDLVNKSYLLIGNISNNYENGIIYLDPTIKLQDADTENLDDGMGYQLNPTRNYGATVAMGGGWSGADREIRPYIKFNISSIPTGATIENATLYILKYYDISTDNYVYYVHHVFNTSVSDWNEGTLDDADCGTMCEYNQNLTWNNQMCGVNFDNSTYCNLTAEDSVTMSSTYQWYNWTVTHAVNRSYSEGALNVSFAMNISSYSDAGYSYFYVKEHGTASERPYLNITYSETIAPQYSDNSTNNTVAGKPTEFRLKWTDNDDLSGYIFSFDNGTEDGRFGYWETATSQSDMYGYIVSYKFQAPANGTLENITIYFKHNSDSNVKAAVYSNSSGAPGSLLGNSSEQSITSTEWWTFPIIPHKSDSVRIVRDEYYYLALQVQTDNALDLNYTTGDTNQNPYRTYTYGDFPDPFGTLTGNLAYKGLIYANFTGMINDTWVSMTGAGNWSNVTKTVNSTAGTTIKWKVYANDTNDNWNASVNFSFVTLPTYCDYSIQDWELPYTISQNNSYYCLASDSYIAGQTAITFNSGTQNTTLDCLNYNLNSDDPSSTYGVYLTGSETKNNTVKNCNITDFYIGIHLNNGPNNNTITNNTANDNSGDGITLYSSSNNTITNNTVNNNDDKGILVTSNSNSNTITNNTVNNNPYGIYIDSTCNNTIITNNTVNSNTYGIYIFSSNSNTITNNTVNSNTYGINLCWNSYNNTITGGSISDNTQYDYYLWSAGTTNNFTNTNFTAERKIYFDDTTSWFNYNNETTGNIWLKTNVSLYTTITRELTNWTTSLMQWNDTASLVVTARYNITGLKASTTYNIYNDSVFVQSLQTDSSGNLPSFTIYLSSEHEIKVKEDVEAPQYSDNSTNNTVAGKPTEFRLKWTNADLSGYIFSLDNCTGSFSNVTEGSLSGTEDWSNVSLVINDTEGCTIKWKVYANDTNDNWNASVNFSFVTLPTYCDYSIQDWELPYTISQNNSYYCLASDSYIAGQTAITFNSGTQNTTLDCLGYNLDSDDTAGISGVYLSGANIKNNTIKNCNITDFYNAISLTYGPNNTITNNTLNNNRAGIHLYRISNTTMTNNTANDNSQFGIFLYRNCTNTLITDNIANNNQERGFSIGSNGTDNTLTNNTANNNQWGIIISSDDNTNFNNILTNNTANNNEFGIIISHGYNNTITGGSVYNNTINDYYIASAGTNNNFTDTNFTDSRVIGFYDVTSWFNYNNETTGNIWLKTNVSSKANITRELINWNNTLMQWNDTNSSGTDITARYNITGLNASRSYSIYNNSVFVQSLQTDSSGNLPSFTIYLSSEHEIKVKEDIEAPKYSDNSTNNTVAGRPTEFRLKWTNDDLSGYIFSFDNGTEDGRFGYWETATSQSDPYGNIASYRFQAPANGTIESITIHFHHNLDSNVKAAVYSNSSGAPGSLLGNSSEQSITSTEWWTFPIIPSVRIVRDEYYYLALQVQTDNALDLNYTSGETGQNPYRTYTYGDFPDPFGTPTDTLAYKVLIYANYTGFINDTWVSMTGSGNWSNVTKTVNSTAGATIRWKVYANDSNDNWNASEIFTFTTLPTYCDYSIQDWELPYTISQNNSYYCLASDEYIGGQTAKNIISFADPTQNSTLDCLNYNLDSDDTADTVGVYLTGSSTKNDTVKNCNITDFADGIYISSSSNNTLSNITVSSNTNNGIYLSLSNYSTLTNITAKDNDNIGIALSTSSNNNLTDITVSSNTNTGIRFGSSSNYNTLTNITAKDNDIGTCILGSSNNNITVGSIASSTTMDYYLRDAGETNNFTNTNFTATRTIYFWDTTSWFNYRNDTASDIWLKTNVSKLGGVGEFGGILVTITRELVSWTQSLVQWNDTNTTGSNITARYNITGLLADTSYKIYNNSVLVDNLQTDSSGVLPSFTIYLSSEHEIKVKEGEAPLYSNNSTNNTVAGRPTLFSLNWTDNVGLLGYIFSTNNTGTWQNDSFVDFENQTGDAIFIDGFESGDFSAWTTYGSTASVTNELSHHGQYSAKGTVGAGSEDGQVRKALDPILSEVYVRIYCRFPVLPSDGKTNTVIWADGGYSMGPGHTDVEGYKWHMNYKGSPWSYFGSYAVNTWYYVEVYYKKGTGTNAIIKVWIDGILELDENDGTGTGLTDIRTGLAWTDESAGSNFIAYVDRVVVADAYIGPDTGWSNVTKTLNSTVGASVRWKVYANDTSDNWNASEIFTLTTTDTTPPTFAHNNSNTTTPGVGEPVLLYANWTDNTDLDWAWLWTNETGGNGQNYTDGTYDSPYDINLTAGETWSNFTWDNDTFYSGVVAWKIYANDSSGNENVTGKMEFTVTAAYLEVAIINPPSTYATQQNQTFPVNASVYCRSGSCGTVSGTAMYNSSTSGIDTLIPTSPTTPFHAVEGSQPQSCGAMSADQFCQLNWTVNATGSQNTDWKIGVNFSSSSGSIADNCTENSTVTISLCTVEISLSWPYINFSSINPNTEKNANPHSGNAANLSNITNTGTCTIHIWIKGTYLENKTYPIHKIGVGNVSWGNESLGHISYDSAAIKENITTSYALVKDILSPDTNVTTYYWLEVPPVYKGKYNGTLTVCGNYTDPC